MNYKFIIVKMLKASLLLACITRLDIGAVNLKNNVDTHTHIYIYMT